ncbi:MAG: AMP-binding enzyme family protein [Ramlibacter sp.]|nr:AMP-binding enzyme family protein [Ramlibacter sp.]
MSAHRPPPGAMVTMPNRLRHWARLKPDGVAMREKELGVWKRLSWKQYETEVRRFALGLLELGFRKGDRLAIAGDNTPEWLVADLAAQSLGGITTGVYPTSPWPELQYVVRHCNARFIVCGDQEQVDKVLDASSQEGGLPELERIICVDMKGMRHYEDPRLLPFDRVSALADGRPADEAHAQWVHACEAQDASDVAIIVYTSGTTGKPKGAQLSHRNIGHTADEFTRLHGLHEDNYVVLSYLPLCHLAERLFSLAMHLSTGGVVNFAESIETVQSNIREIAPTVFLGVPRIWQKMQQSIRVRSQEAPRLQRWAMDRAFDRAFRRLKVRDANRQPSGAPAPMGWLERIEYGVLWLLVFRSIAKHLGFDRSLVRICGAAPVSPETLRFFEVLGLPTYQAYGLTEGGMSFSQHKDARMSGGVGTPLPGMEYRLAEDGEVLLRGPAVFAGYLHDAQGTRNILGDDGWLRSGDIAEQMPAGELRIVDRKKEIIVTSGGKNIAPSEMENALKEAVYIREAIVIGEQRHFVSALIQIDTDAVGNWAAAQNLSYTNYRSLSQLPEVRALVAAEVDRCNERFAQVARVRKFVILQKELDHDDGELTATQKVRRSVIEKKYATEISSIYGQAA